MNTELTVLVLSILCVFAVVPQHTSTTTGDQCREAIRDHTGEFRREFQASEVLTNCILVFGNHNQQYTEFNIQLGEGIELDVFLNTNHQSRLYYHQQGGAAKVVMPKYCTFVITVPTAEEKSSVRIAYKPTSKELTPKQDLQQNPTYGCSWYTDDITLLKKGQRSGSCMLCFSKQIFRAYAWNIKTTQRNVNVHYTVDILKFTDSGTVFSHSTEDNGKVSEYATCLYVSVNNGPYAEDIGFESRLVPVDKSFQTRNTYKDVVGVYPGKLEKDFAANAELIRWIISFGYHESPNTEFTIQVGEGITVDVFLQYAENSLFYYHQQGVSETVTMPRYCTFVITIPAGANNRHVRIGYKPTSKELTPKQDLQKNPTYNCSQTQTGALGSTTLMEGQRTSGNCYLCFPPSWYGEMQWDIKGIQNNDNNVYFTVDIQEFTSEGTLLSQSTKNTGKMDFSPRCLYISINEGSYQEDIVLRYRPVPVDDSFQTGNTYKDVVGVYPGKLEKDFAANAELIRWIISFGYHESPNTEFTIQVGEDLTVYAFADTNEQSLLYHQQQGGSRTVIMPRKCTFIITVPAAAIKRHVLITYKPTSKELTSKQDLQQNPTYKCSQTYKSASGSTTLMTKEQKGGNCFLCFPPSAYRVFEWDIKGIKNKDNKVYFTVDNLQFDEFGTYFRHSVENTGEVYFFPSCLYISINEGSYQEDIVFHHTTVQE